MRGFRILDNPPTCDAHRTLPAVGSSVLHVAVLVAAVAFGSASFSGAQQAPFAFDVILVADAGLGAATVERPVETHEPQGRTEAGQGVVSAVAEAALPPSRADLEMPTEMPSEMHSPQAAPEPIAPSPASFELEHVPPETDLGEILTQVETVNPLPKPEPKPELSPKPEAKTVARHLPVKPRRMQTPVPTEVARLDAVEESAREETAERGQPVEVAAEPAGQTAGQTAGPPPEGAAQRLAHADGGASSAGGDLPVVTDPRFRRTPRTPVYPRRAIELDQQGVVLVRALVREDGSAEETVIWRSSGFPLLDAAATAAVRGWEFEPLRLAGAPRPAWVQIPVKFSLKE